MPGLTGFQSISLLSRSPLPSPHSPKELPVQQHRRFRPILREDQWRSEISESEGITVNAISSGILDVVLGTPIEVSSLL